MMVDDEKLIDLVRSNEVLYNKFCIGYRLPDKKKAAWNNIAKELGVTEEQCCRRWINLRERFSREMKRMDAPSGSGAACCETWALFGALSFLREHVKPRPQRCTSNLEGNFLSSSSPTIPEPISPSPLISSPQPGTFLPEATPRSSSAKRRRVNYNEIDEDFKEACNAHKQMCMQRAAPRNEAVHGFGQMIVASISAMNARKQAIAMQGITDYVMRLQLEE